jgi:uroporphyrinogen decarboxylase
MTDRERFNRQMHYKSVDRSFNMEFGYWEENYQVWDLFTLNHITNEAEANEFFNFDKISGIGTNTWMNPGFQERIVE